MPPRKTRPRRPPSPPAAPPPQAAEPAATPGRHAAGIDAGDRTHWACVGATPDGADTAREFPAHTPGLRDLVAWLKACGVTTVALEATGAYAHVLFLALLEAGFEVLMAPPHFARQIKGRPKTDRLDCQWVRRLHHLGLLPSVFQPDDATQTLRDYVRQRANLVRLGAQHVQRMQKALLLMNPKPTAALGATTGVTGLRIIRAIVAGERDPHAPARLRDRRCRPSAAEIATALDGRYRPEHLTELRLCLTLWDASQAAIAALDPVIAAHLTGCASRPRSRRSRRRRGSAGGSRTTRGSTCGRRCTSRRAWT